MTKTKTKQTITLETILNTLDAHELEEARKILYAQKSARMNISGTVEKVIKRHGGLKLYLKPDGLPEGRNFMIFADFTDEREQTKVKAAKVKKRAQIALTGDFSTAGVMAISIKNCCKDF